MDERALTVRFGVSRTPRREAPAQLEVEVVIQTLPRREMDIARKTKADYWT